jgi:hypothetical protein
MQFNAVLSPLWCFLWQWCASSVLVFKREINALPSVQLKSITVPSDHIFSIHFFQTKYNHASLIPPTCDAAAIQPRRRVRDIMFEFVPQSNRQPQSTIQIALVFLLIKQIDWIMERPPLQGREHLFRLDCKWWPRKNDWTSTENDSFSANPQFGKSISLDRFITMRNPLWFHAVFPGL